jgi:uncharacterized protein (DUF58 family)
MRPSRRLIALALAAFAVSVIAVALGGGARDWAVMVWLALGGLLAADLVMSLRRRLGVEASAPAEVFIGETVEMTLRSDRAEAGLEARIDWPSGLVGPAEIRLAPDDGGGIGHLSLTARRRGVWPIEQLWLRWPSRLKLLEFTPRVALDLTIAAIPNIRPVLSGVIDAKVRSALFGVKENFAKGEGSEFHQLRDFTQGMDVRAIDWKRSARRRQLVAKEMRAERNHHVIIALDNGHLMREEIDGLPKIDHAVNAGLAVAWAAAIGGDYVGLFAFDAKPQLFLPPEPGRRAFARLRSRTAELVYSSVESNHTLAMAALHARTPRRSLIVIFSDFVDTTTAELLMENVAVLSRRHVVICVALKDPSLEALAASVPDSLDDVAQAVTAGEMLRERRLVMERLSRLGVVVLDVASKAVTPRLISTYLDLKAREVL